VTKTLLTAKVKPLLPSEPLGLLPGGSPSGAAGPGARSSSRTRRVSAGCASRAPATRTTPPASPPGRRSWPAGP